MDYGYEKMGAIVATFGSEAVLMPGDLVVMSGNGVVSKANDGDDPIGVVVSVSGKEVGVQVAGGAEIHCEDENLAVGFSAVQVMENSIAKAADGKLRLVFAVDAAAKTASILL